MKRIYALMLSVIMILTLTACGDSEDVLESEQNSVEEQNSIEEQIQEEVQPEEPAEENPNVNDEDLLKDIVVTYEVDEMMQQAIVTIENTGSMTFDSSVGVHFQNSSGKSIGDDMIFVESLAAGNSTYARINLNEIDVADFDYNFNSPSFEAGPASSGGTRDDAASASLSTEFEGSFGGAGNPEWATSWYHFVTDVSVFSSNDGSYAVITVSDDIDQESADRIGNTIFGNYSKDFSLVSVSVINSAGEELFLKAS